jgi:hypothetical protein
MLRGWPCYTTALLTEQRKKADPWLTWEVVERPLPPEHKFKVRVGFEKTQPQRTLAAEPAP